MIQFNNQAAGESKDPEYLTKQQLATRLGISVRTVETLMADHKLPYIRFTRKLVRFPAAEVDSFLRQHFLINGSRSFGGGL